MKLGSLFARLKSFVGNQPKSTLYAVLALCFFVRVSYQVFYIKYYQFYDPYRNSRDPIGAYEYEPLARNIASGRGYRIPDPLVKYPTARRVPVYPFFLSFIYLIFGINRKLALLFQGVFDTFTCLVIYRISLLLFKRQGSALLSSLMWAFYLPGVFFVNKFYSEPLFTLLLSLFIFLSVKSLKTPRTSYFIWSGVSLGIATLCRPVTLLFVLAACLYYSVRFRAKARYACLVLFASFSLTLAPWVIRNYLTFGRFIPTSTSLGFSLFLRNGLVLDKEDYLAPVDFQRYSDFEKKLDRRYDFKTLNEPEVSEIYMDEALKVIQAHPLNYLVLSLKRFPEIWFNLGSRGYVNLKEYFFFFINAPLMLLAILAYLRFKGDWVGFSLPLLFLLLYNTLIHMLVAGNIRYAVPVIPYLIIPAAFALTGLLED